MTRHLFVQRGNGLALSTLLMVFACIPGTGVGAQLTVADTTRRSVLANGGNLTGSIAMDDSSDELHITVGHSTVITTKSRLRRIYIADPKVIQGFASGEKEEVITGRAAGTTTLMLWDDAGIHKTYVVSVDVDVAPLRASLAELAPGSELVLSARGDRVLVAGTVASEAVADLVKNVVTSFSKEASDVVRVAPAHPRQVQLKLRIVEVDRSKLEQFGVNLFALGNTLANSTTGQFASAVIPGNTASGTSLSVSDPLNLLLYSATLNAGLTVKDLEQKQILQILAEPTLTTMSGVPARFLSGGEFPLPVVQGGTGNSTAITILFRPYGVKVDFTPTVNWDRSIHLKVAPEVSALDYTNAVTISGFTIPALSTRRAETEVELRDGQSFVLSGLLDHRTSDALSRVPVAGSLPILGELFRSKNLSRSVVELVVLVTATIVDPLKEAMPTSQPSMVMPNLNTRAFDHSVRSSNRLQGKSNEQP